MIGPAAAVLCEDSQRVLGLRSRRAATVILAGEFRLALPEFDALADAYRRTSGPTSREAS
jgi:eukaryotic-like serine/threonine-protein kinase